MKILNFLSTLFGNKNFISRESPIWADFDTMENVALMRMKKSSSDPLALCVFTFVWGWSSGTNVFSKYYMFVFMYFCLSFFRFHVLSLLSSFFLSMFYMFLFTAFLKDIIVYYSRLRSNMCLKSPLDSYDAPSFGMLRVKAWKSRFGPFRPKKEKQEEKSA